MAQSITWPAKALVWVLTIQAAVLPVTTDARAGEDDECRLDPRAALYEEVKVELEAAGGERSLTFRDNSKQTVTLAEIREHGASSLIVELPRGQQVQIDIGVVNGAFTTAYSERKAQGLAPIAKTELEITDSQPQVMEKLAEALRTLKDRCDDSLQRNPFGLAKVLVLLGALSFYGGMQDGSKTWMTASGIVTFVCVFGSIGYAAHLSHLPRKGRY